MKVTTKDHPRGWEAGLQVRRGDHSNTSSPEGEDGGQEASWLWGDESQTTPSFYPGLLQGHLAQAAERQHPRGQSHSEKVMTSVQCGQSTQVGSLAAGATPTGREEVSLGGGPGEASAWKGNGVAK